MKNLTVKIEEIESAEELENIIQQNQLEILDESCNAYCYVTMGNDYIIGIEYRNHGIDIEYKLTDNNQYIYLGIGMHLLYLNINKREIAFCEKLGSAFLDLLKYVFNCYYIIICELDLYVYKDNNQLWEIGFRDIVADYELVDNKYIRILSDDGEEMVFSIKDGNVVL